jgi:hypothetical protein
MGGWLKDVKDADKVGLLLLFTGLLISVLGTAFTVWVAFHIKDENILDRVLVAVAGLTAQGGGLVTAAMGVLRFQSKNDSPPTVDKVTTTVQQAPPVEAPKP